MSGEGLTTSFRRTTQTTKSNKQLLREFQNIIYASRVTTHMKWYGEAESVQLIEHGDEELPKFQQEYVAIKDTFQFCISVYDSWHQDADLYESYELEDSFVSIAYDFAKANNFTDAIIQYTKAIELEPDYEKAYMQRAGAYSQIGEHNSAAEDYDRALAFEEKDAEIYYLSGKAWHLYGDNRLALVRLTAAISLKSNFDEACRTNFHLLVELGG